MATTTKTNASSLKKTVVRMQGRSIALEKSNLTGLYRKPARSGEKPISRAALSKALEQTL